MRLFAIVIYPLLTIIPVRSQWGRYILESTSYNNIDIGSWTILDQRRMKKNNVTQTKIAHKYTLTWTSFKFAHYKHKIDGIRLGIVYCWVYHTTQQTGQRELMGNLQSWIRQNPVWYEEFLLPYLIYPALW